MDAKRLPPQNLDAERAVLGSMIRDNRVIDSVVLQVTSESFYTDAHRRIFAALFALHSDGQAADLVTLAEEIKRRGELEDIGGHGYISELWDAAPTAGNAEYYARIVRETSLLRGLIHASNEIIRDAYDQVQPASEAVEAAEKLIFALAESAVASEVADAAKCVGEVFDHIDACKADRGSARGVRTGFIELDNKIGGLQPGSLTLFAARPSIGKTALGVAVTLNWTFDGQPVFFASLEQTRQELMERMMCSRAKVDSLALRAGLLNEIEIGRLAEAGDEIRRLCRLNIDHCGEQTVLRIAANARRMKRRHGLAAIVVDYIQLVSPSDRRAARYEQVGDISRRLKALAKELTVPVLAMCQLNRAAEDRADGRPRLSDLRESGSLEMDADCVVLISQSNIESSKEIKVIELQIAKNRNGPLGDVKLVYQPKYTRFMNYAQGLPPPGHGDLQAPVG